MKERVDIHHRQRCLETLQRNLTVLTSKNKNPISEHNAKLITKFVKEYALQKDLSTVRQYFYLTRLKTFARYVNKPVDELTLEDVENYIFYLKNSQYTQWTQQGKKLALRLFYTWLKKPELVRFKLTKKRSEQEADKQILVKQEIDALMQSCNCSRDRAMIAVLWESGARIEEFLNMRFENVQFTDEGVKVSISGKTGKRTNLLVESAGYLAQWCNEHPLRDTPSAHIWCRLKRSGAIDARPLAYCCILRVLKLLVQRAGINKHVYPHLFRHSRATFLANCWTEVQLCKWFGWVIGSNMPRVYVARSGVDTDNAVRKLYGLKKETAITTPFIDCPRCKNRNNQTDQFCSRCGLPLNDKVAENIKETERKLLESLTPEHIDEMINARVDKIIAERKGGDSV